MLDEEIYGLLAELQRDLKVPGIGGLQRPPGQVTRSRAAINERFPVGPILGLAEGKEQRAMGLTSQTMIPYPVNPTFPRILSCHGLPFPFYQGGERPKARKVMPAPIPFLLLARV